MIGKKAIHLMQAEERRKSSRVNQLWVDVGAEDRDVVAGLGVRVGDPMVISQGMVRLAGELITKSGDRRPDRVRSLYWKPSES